MRHLDLFSGLGAFALACSWHGIKTTQFVEIDSYCQTLLRRNFPGIPIHGDVATFTASPGEFDLITFGSPCPGFSLANPNGRGLEDYRSRLFFEAIRIVREARPRFFCFENVAGIFDRGLERVLWEVAHLGLYECEWQVISASSLGAPHQRQRLFIVAYAKGTGKGGTCSPQTRANQTLICGDSWWRQNPHPEPSICGLGDGISRRLARQQLMALGNSIVPQVASIPIKRILELSND